MPLPNLKQQCTAQNRNKQRRCLNPAAFGCKTCRYHGARRQIAKGTNHPNYKHGNRSQSAIKSFSKASQELDMIEDMARIHWYGRLVAEEDEDRDDYWFQWWPNQPDRAPNKAETCAVLQRRYTDVRHALSALNVNRHWLN